MLVGVSSSRAVIEYKLKTLNAVAEDSIMSHQIMYTVVRTERLLFSGRLDIRRRAEINKEFQWGPEGGVMLSAGIAKIH